MYSGISILPVIADVQHTQTLKEFSELVLSAVCRYVGADGATLVLQEAGDCFYADEKAISPLWKGRRFASDCCISGLVMRENQSVRISDITNDNRIPHEIYERTFVKSLCMVPVGFQKPLAAIGTYWQKKYLATDEQVLLLEMLATNIASKLNQLQTGGKRPEISNLYQKA